MNYLVVLSLSLSSDKIYRPHLIYIQLAGSGIEDKNLAKNAKHINICAINCEGG